MDGWCGGGCVIYKKTMGEKRKKPYIDEIEMGNVKTVLSKFVENQLGSEY